MSMLKHNELLFLCDGNKLFLPYLFFWIFSIFYTKFVRLLGEILKCILLTYLLTSLFLYLTLFFRICGHYYTLGKTDSAVMDLAAEFGSQVPGAWRNSTVSFTWVIWNHWPVAIDV